MCMIPIVENLIGKGLPVSTALAFLMAATAFSLPELILSSGSVMCRDKTS